MHGSLTVNFVSQLVDAERMHSRSDMILSLLVLPGSLTVSRKIVLGHLYHQHVQLHACFWHGFMF